MKKITFSRAELLTIRAALWCSMIVISDKMKTGGGQAVNDLAVRYKATRNILVKVEEELSI